MLVVSKRRFIYALQNDSAETATVRIARDKFDVTTRNGAVRFLRSMYNLKSIVMDADGRWDKDKEQLCAELSRALKKLPSLSTQRSKSKSKSASANRMPPIAEYQSDLAGQSYQIYQFSTTVRVSCPQSPAGYTALTPPRRRSIIISPTQLLHPKWWY